MRWFALGLLAACSSARPPPAPIPNCREASAVRPEPARADSAPVRGLRNIQRTMRLLATSSPTQPNRVRILFYGQSITQSAWSRAVAAQLRARFPHAQLEIENRALGGFSSERLVETAETDLYPWQPDLVIFHVYGAHDRYEEIIQRVRARTTAELILHTDHVLAAAELDEPLAPCASPPDAAHWSAFMNQAFLPSLVERYQVALCDVRAAWKLHLRERALAPGTLLADGLHPNALGDLQLAQLVGGCLRFEPSLGTSPAEAWVETIDAAQLTRTERGVQLPFQGRGVDVTVAAGAGHVQVRIDGAPPSQRPELYGFARAHTEEIGRWPPLHGLTKRAPLLAETFTIALQRTRPEGPYTFQVQGSTSGDEGTGSTDAPFVSRSGRLVIEPANWDLDYTFELAQRPPPAAFTVQLRVQPQFVDAFALPSEGERTFHVAHGLDGDAHLLELEGELAALRSVTVHRPPRR